MEAQQGLPFARQLRGYRQGHGLTQEELAERAGLSARGIRALEQGERSTPHRDTVRLLAEALDLTPEQWSAFEKAAAGVVSEPNRSHVPTGGFLGATPVMPIIGREKEIGTLVHVVDAVVHGSGRLVMLAGEPGVGKTRLAQELVSTLQDRGFLTATGRCYRPEQAVPYFPFREALAVAARSALSLLRMDISQRWPYLSLLLPDGVAGGPTLEIASRDTTQQVIFWEVDAFLTALAQVTPVAVLLDDLHWADTSTLNLFLHLARYLRGERVLLVGTYRDVDITRSHPLESVLRELRRDGLLDDIPVGRLDQGSTATLAAALLGEARVAPDFATLLHQHTDGNPFYTQEVVRALVDRGDVFRRDGTQSLPAVDMITIPPSVRSAIDERVSRLSGQTQDIIREASVLGQTFQFDDLARLSARDEADLEDALEEALSAMLLRDAGNDAYAFNHALTQQTLYAQLSPRRRKRFHAAIGIALVEMPADIQGRRSAQIAWHFLQAEETGQALPYASLAGDEAEAVFAHSEAEQHYRTALDLSRELGDRRREAEALEKLGLVARITARYGEALEAFEGAAAISADTGSVEDEARANRELAFIHYYRGTPEQANAQIRSMIERLEKRTASLSVTRALANLYGSLSMVLWPLADYRGALSVAERASELAQLAQYAHAEALAETFRGMTLTMIGSLPDARNVLERATALCRASGEQWWTLNAIGSIGRAYMDEGDFAGAQEYLNLSRSLIETIRERAETAWIDSNLGELHYLAGRWSDARDEYGAAVRMGREVEDDRYLSYALLHLAELDAAEGHWDTALRLIEEGIELGQNCNAVPTLRKGQRLLAEYDLMHGDGERAIARLEPFLGGTEDDYPRAFPPPVLAEAYLQTGQIARAEDLVLQRAQRFRRQGHRRALTLWLRVQGTIRARQNSWDEADRAFAEAISIAHALPYPHAEGRSLFERGMVHRHDGDSEQARAWLGEALAIFRRLGAHPDMVRTEEALRDP